MRITDYKNLVNKPKAGAAEASPASAAPAELLGAFPSAAPFLAMGPWLAEGAAGAARPFGGIANAALLMGLANHHHHQFQRNHAQMLHSSE